MFGDALKLQLLNFLLSCVQYIIVLVLGVIVGTLLSSLVGFTAFVATYTTLPVTTITIAFMFIIAIIKG